MKFLILLFFISTVSAQETFTCENGKYFLEIQVANNVHWTFYSLSAPEEKIQGSGDFHKESDSEDAFSSYDDVHALSYKLNRAVFVLSDNDVSYFPVCTHSAATASIIDN